MNDFLYELINHREEVLSATASHLTISATAIILGIIIAVPAGIFLSYHERTAKVVMTVFGIINTIPSIVLLGVAMIFFGIGFKPAVAVLFVYSLLPVMRGTYTGLKEVSPKAKKAAKGMGMSRLERIRYVELPLALPAIITGIRLSAIYIISWATLAAFIGAGGLGDIIWMGLQSYNFSLVMCGAIPAAVLALVVSICLNMVIKRASRHKEEVHI